MSRTGQANCRLIAFEEIKELNNEFIHLTNSELSTYLQTAKTTQYKYKKSTLAQYLENNIGVDPSYLFENEPVRLSLVERKEKQRSGALNSAKAKRDNTFTKLKSNYIKAKSSDNNPTQKSVAKNSELSVRTVRRYWRELTNIQGDIRLVSI